MTRGKACRIVLGAAVAVLETWAPGSCQIKQRGWRPSVLARRTIASSRGRASILEHGLHKPVDRQQIPLDELLPRCPRRPSAVHGAVTHGLRAARVPRDRK